MAACSLLVAGPRLALISWARKADSRRCPSWASAVCQPTPPSQIYPSRASSLEPWCALVLRLAFTAAAASRIRAGSPWRAPSRRGWRRLWPRGHSDARQPFSRCPRRHRGALLSLARWPRAGSCVRVIAVPSSGRGRDASTLSMGLFGGSVTCTDRYGALFRSTNTYNRDITRRALNGVYKPLRRGGRTTLPDSVWPRGEHMRDMRYFFG